MSSLVSLSPAPSSRHTTSGRAQLPSPAGRRELDEGLRIALTPNPPPATGEGSVERACGAELEAK
jgi:hypothetical protein